MVVIDQSPPPIVCTLAEDSVSGGVRLRGRVVSQQDAHGEYRLKVKKIGPSGSTNLNQKGAFSAPAKTETYVGSTNISLEQGAQYEVQFAIDVDGKTYQCTAPGGAKT
jgi:hypothetical protein